MLLPHNETFKYQSKEVKTNNFFSYIPIVPETDSSLMSMLDFRYFTCVMKREWKCPDSEINFYLFTP